jgi:hypothetical protein
MSGYDLFTNTMIGVATTLILSCGVAVCCKLRQRYSHAPEGTPLPPQNQNTAPTAIQVQPTAPYYYPSTNQRYTVYMPQSYYPQMQPSAYQSYPPQTQPYPPQTQSYPPQTQSYPPQTQSYPPQTQPNYTMNPLAV